MFSQLVFVLRSKIKQACPLFLVHMRFLFSLSLPEDTCLTHVPPQPNSPPDYVFRTDQLPKEVRLKQKTHTMQVSVSRKK